MNTKKHKHLLFAVYLYAIMIFISGCGALKGEFAFRNFGDEAYRKIDGIPEFEKTRKVEWVFVFKNAGDTRKISVVLLKKELVWVDIDSRLENVSEGNNIIYGQIENFDEGRYRIMISEESAVIDEKEFTVFIDDDVSTD